jgi:hypothetical protein
VPRPPSLYDAGDEDDYTLPDVSSNCCDNDSSVNSEESMENNEVEGFNTKEANLSQENHSEIKDDGQKLRSSGFLTLEQASMQKRMEKVYTEQKNVQFNCEQHC